MARSEGMGRDTTRQGGVIVDVKLEKMKERIIDSLEGTIQVYFH